MAYIDLMAIKQHLGIVGTADDAYLSELIASAQTTLELIYGRRFDAVTETRLYGPDEVLDGRLLLGGDLLSVDTLTNGDGTVIPALGFRLWPYSLRPASRIELRGGYRWQFAADGLIAVAGSWGYLATPPANVVQAMKELVSNFYQLEDARAAGLKRVAQAYRNVDQLPQRVQELMRGLTRISL